MSRNARRSQAFTIVLLFFTLSQAWPSLSFLNLAAGTTGGQAIHPLQEQNLVSMPRNTTYTLEFTYTITNERPFSRDFMRWFPRVSNRTLLPGVTSPGGPVYQQEVNLIQENWNPAYVNNHREMSGIHGNDVVFFDFTIPGAGTWQYSYQVNVTLREVDWNTGEGITRDAYNKSSTIYQLYTREEEKINKSHPLIIQAVQGLNDSDVIKTARNVYDFVVSSLTYNSTMAGEYGAEWAIENLQGDCTEFSFLMVAMLRAAGIPARTVRGFAIADSSLQGVRPDFDAPVGHTWHYGMRFDDTSPSYSNITGHSWLEYYVPGLGWVVADPTWATSGDYFNRIDTVHLGEYQGTWIGEGFDPGFDDYASFDETYPTFPLFGSPALLQLYNYTVRVAGQEANESPLDLFNRLLEENQVAVALIAGAVLGVAILGYLAFKLRGTRKESGKDTRNRNGGGGGDAAGETGYRRVFFD